MMLGPIISPGMRRGTMKCRRSSEDARALDICAFRLACEDGDCTRQMRLAIPLARAVSRCPSGEAEGGNWANLGVRLVISCFSDYGVLPELDINATSIYIWTAR